MAKRESKADADGFGGDMPDGWVYIHGLDRNDQHTVVSHIYAGPNCMDPVGPLCVRGWNRSDGNGFSIFRGNTSDKGVCKVCQRRKCERKGPVQSRPRKTKYI